jgi:hypothetical protein
MMIAIDPGTEAASAHVIQDSPIPACWRANSATRGFGAVAVRNMADTTRSP